MSSSPPLLSIVIAARNATAFLGDVLASIRPQPPEVEVVVVDDCSDDHTASLAASMGARVVSTPSPSGAAVARNLGARHARGAFVMFTDHDCCLEPDTLARLLPRLETLPPKTVLGGTYSLSPRDAHRFASCFQSLHVHYSETRSREPDYIASHFFVMRRAEFLQEGGFPEELSGVLPNGCCQDVLFCHTLRRRGYSLSVDPSLRVAHIFNFTIRHSIYNAFWKSRAWTRVALWEGSLLRDSGSASTEMKLSAPLACGACACAMAGAWWPVLLVGSLVLLALSVLVNHRFYAFVLRHRGLWFTTKAIGLYSLQLMAITAGGLAGLWQGPFRGIDRSR